MPTEEDLIAERKRKTTDLRNAGINPYPYRYEATHHALDVQKTFADLKSEEQSGKTVNVAGRIVGLRRIGKITFIHLQDEAEKVQILFKQESIGEEKYILLKLL
ncbi:MAG: OB-fold nucleic acid binding domain-containing protein, partial [Candidatus Woesearchaeota archaeon]|nr:OB-fold nucleic acid binding domain-containing protein [Candidatus Woesearchaeota archaeon]